MTFFNRATSVVTTLALALVITACGPKDAEIKMAADQALVGTQGVTVEVANGVATVSGEFADEAAKTATDAALKAVKGVKSVVDNATVMPPPPPVVISADESLKAGINAVLMDFSTVTADVADGIVTLTGEIKKSDLPKLMQALSALNPKKIENKATIK